MPDRSVDSPPRGLRLVARRVAVWTSNLLASGLVLVVFLTLGRQLTSWWAIGPGDPSQTAPHGDVFLEADPWGGEAALHQLSFGGLPLHLGRQTVVGGKSQAFAALRAQCRLDAERGLASRRVPGPDEQGMLTKTAGMEPADEEPGKWKMYQLDGPVPLVVVIGLCDDAAAGEGGQPAPRVVCWGLAFPAAANAEAWTLFTCVPREGLTDPAAGRPVLPVPPGAQQRMALRGADGAGLVLLAGSGQAEKWREFFDAWFQQQGWSSGDGWQTVGATRHCRYGHESQGFVVDVVLESREELHALMTVTRASVVRR